MSKTIDVSVSRHVGAAPEQVWSVLDDLRRLPEWLAFAKTVEDVSGPAAPGATYVVKPHHAYEPTTHWTVREADAPRRQLHVSEMPVVTGVRSEIEVTADGAGSSVHVHWTGTPKGLPGTLMRAMMQKRITESWERSLERLGTLV